MNLIEHVAEHLEFLGFGELPTTESDGSVFWGTMPETPDKAICIYSNDSATPGSASGARIQIMVRARETRTSYETSQAIADELDDFDGFLHGDGPHVYIEAMNVSQGLGTDAKRREMYASNFRVFYCDY